MSGAMNALQPVLEIVDLSISLPAGADRAFDRERAVRALRQCDAQAGDGEHRLRRGRHRSTAHRVLPFSRVFRPSFRPSPTRFSASTVSTIARPGNSAIHQACRNTVRAEPTM